MERPVFVIGCPRSGTTLLHHMLLSAGGFAIYDTESNVFNMLVPTFGDLRLERNRRRLLDAWLNSHLFRASGLERETLRQRLLDEGRSGGSFLRILMEEIARAQRVNRWVEHSPSHLFHVAEIRQAFPEALFVHVIRDGRDVAVSLGKMGWFQKLPLANHDGVLAAGIFWQWMAGWGRKCGSTLGPNYAEVRYEELVQQPRAALKRLEQFIQHDLDYDQIQRTAIGSVKKPNTSFLSERDTGAFNPLERWKRDLTPRQLLELEFVTGELLQELGYSLASAGAPSPISTISLTALRHLYIGYFNVLLWLKQNTPLHRYFASRNIDYRLSH